MAPGITIRILGDYGPFSRMGKSIGYQLTVGESRFLIDCGAPLFQQIGGHGLKGIRGLIITHCHDDHKRWFSDLALFNKYAPDISGRVSLLTSEEVHNELIRASGPALETSLSEDSGRVIDIPYDSYIEHRTLGPRARYRILARDEGRGKTSLLIADRNGSPLGPERAKIVISEKTGRPRMLFKDPHYGEWIEPESFYPYSSTEFYEDDRNTYDPGEGFTIDALKAPVWHGVPGIGLVVRTRDEIVVFSSDTAHNTQLWKQLCSEKRTQRLAIPTEEFEALSVIRGDINDYVERIWSEERYEDAIHAFDNAFVIHDISLRNSVVHTNYDALHKTSLRRDRSVLTHSPDKITSEWVLCRAEKTFTVRGNGFFEVVGDRLYPMNADIYHKEAGRYYVGYRNERGRVTVYESEGLLSLSCDERFDAGIAGKPLYRIDLYEDISGRYFPTLHDRDALYRERKDGKVELVEFTGEGSRGRVVEDQRDRLT